MSAIEKAAELLMSWSGQVDETHAVPGTIEAMRTVATAARAEYARLQQSPGARHDAVIKAWALRELEALPRGAWRDWIRQGTPGPELAALLARLPQPVAALVLEHVADDLDDCETCRRRAPVRLQSDGTESGERDWRCAWGCPPREDDPATAAMLREWARECGL